MKLCPRRGCTRVVFCRDLCRPCYYRLRRYGVLPAAMVDAAPARQWIERQVARGRACHALADLAGVEPRTVQWVHDGTSRRIRTTTADLIMGVPLPPTKVGTVRRWQALARAGYDQATVAAAAGVPLPTIKHALRHTLRARVSEAVATAYGELSGRPGPNRHVAAIAARKGWPSPLAWDDDIDDPAAVPQGTDRVPGRAEPEDVAWLESFGESPEQIAKALRIKVETVAAIRRRAAA